MLDSTLTTPNISQILDFWDNKKDKIVVENPHRQT